jgi:conjugative transfer signal peptidase TraF
MLTDKKMVMGLWTVAGVILAAGMLANALGLRINLTPSMPVGLYWAQIRSTQPLQRDALVLFCPPATRAFQLALSRGYIAPGSCPNHSQALLKPVAAVAGDTVTLTPQGVRVNQTWLSQIPIFSKDSAGRPLPRPPFGQYTVRSGEVWLLSTHSPKSYDSRYFGPIVETRITATATPLWTGE